MERDGKRERKWRDREIEEEGNKGERKKILQMTWTIRLQEIERGIHRDRKIKGE